ncbi:MAG: sugar ABC transporter substrate-binding protein [Anaerolineales bacterium]|nr:sugar ABC transporter substrate-binding protein [Anaerolineales bacterium]
MNLSKRLSVPSILALLSILLLMLSVACSTETPGDNVSSDNGEATSSTISFMVFGDPAELAAYQNLVAAFEEQFSTIKVELIHVPGQGDYRTRLATDFAAGTPADVVLINYRRYAAFAARGVLEPLGPYLENSEIITKEDFYPVAIAPFHWQGELSCIPQNLSSLVVYYNKQIFDTAGLPYPTDDWTWAEFLATAQTLTLDLDGDGAIDQFGLGTEPSIFRLAPFIWQNGGDLVDDPQNPTRLTLDTPEASEAMQWFVDLQVTHHVVPSAEEEAAEESESRFQNGRLAMFLNSRRGVPTYRQIEGFDWDVAALPQNKQQAGILHADAYCMAAVAENKELVWQFIEFANSIDGQTIVAQSGRTVPSLMAVAESPAFLDPEARPQNSQVFLSTVPAIRGVPIMETWVDIEVIAGDELERAFYGHATVAEVIQATTERTQTFFAETR